MKTINVLQPKFRTKEVLGEIEKCLNKGWTGMGYKTVEFEQAWSDYTGLKYSHFLQSNTVGLHLALKIFKHVYGWKDGDEVITTPLTFISTNHAILYENLKPVFADVDEFLCLDVNSIRDRITKKTKAVMFVGMGGSPGYLPMIKQLCDEDGLKLILDAAHMAGTYVRQFDPDGVAFYREHVGKDADVSVFSFQAVKNLPTADSGMICFKDEEHDDLARKMSWLGIDKDTYSRSMPDGSYKWKYDVPYVGHKYHGNSVMAAIGLVQLKYLDLDNDYRNKLANMYDEVLEDYSFIQTVPMSQYCEKSSRHLYQVQLRTPSRLLKFPSEKRDAVINLLYENGIYPGVHYIDNTTYPMYKYAHGTCPNASRISNEIISLPLHLNLKKYDVMRAAQIVEEVMNG